MAYDAHGFRARAVHTDRPTLATAAYMDWSAELRRLHELRHGREVLLHWCHAVEIQHFPPHFDRMPELPGVLPPVRVAACVAANCARCEAGRGGFQFPWIGTFTRRDVLVEAGIPPQVAWARVSACSECLSAEEVRQASSGLTVDDVAPSHINRLVAVLADQQERATRVWLQPMIFGKCGGHGNEASGAGGNQHMSPWQGERQRSATLWPGQAAHYGFGWALSRQASRTSILLAQPVDSPLCSCATYATASCALIAPGRAELAALSRLALALLGAGLVLPSGTSVQTMDKDGLRSGPQALQCPFGWLIGELPMASAWTRTLPLLSAVWRRRLEMQVQKWP